jgi:hypothetical protein
MANDVENPPDTLEYEFTPTIVGDVLLLLAPAAI